MFYLLAATWCPVGETTPAFTIGDDGTLVFDWKKGPACLITSAKGMDQPTGVYNIVWRCGKDLVPERLETYITKPAEGGRSFFLTRHLNEPRKRKTYEQCAELPGSNPSNASQRPAVPPPAINPLDPNTPLPPVPAQQPPKYQ